MITNFPNGAFEDAQQVYLKALLYNPAGNIVTVNVIKTIAEKLVPKIHVTKKRVSEPK
ncbi:hypothetical protein IK1_04110 [Bacillus cereus VD146]|uniref:Uncharacterized protein n=1 Tax=Bacillus cereus (strain VD146) TaxID=1053236 RepID=R8NIS1_BACCX|nr:hypothetical protein IK1_04110 [Bacillus cereus VD146]